jgi:hypothetical protein
MAIERLEEEKEDTISTAPPIGITQKCSDELANPVLTGAEGASR